ncbi:hypothetical protein Arub01_46000 [Actinomadura rubrobrunea]|uniref:DUF3616 domain-containing protein n=1 Tax=Actinomadura rubrobrunea TaxID=115335 RepID=A0A9W6Q063_9ACTN|nr:DUF3616 domain-containing protein [Actinomadura rubrobrunea]GLW66356.1 hypothetical protein Arub01_46000 [Actinomadura rubrobrunea]
MIVERRVELLFGQESREAETHTNLSAVRQDGRCLWAAGDETATVERLTASVDGDGLVSGYGDQRTVPLADLVPLPAGPDEEADIEGLARTDGWLWAIGSHSLKRKKVKDGHSVAKSRKRLATVVREENRFVLVRMPLVAGADGLPEVTRRDGERTAAVLGGHGDSITDALADDPHLAPFLRLPGKDNGVDIEGIAAHRDRLYVGLRGPVLRGWAVLVEIRPETHPDDPHRLRLCPIGGDGALYRTHFLDLDGLGVRDLCPHGDDLLLLTGPSMDLDGPVRVVRWPGAASIDSPGVVHASELEVLGELPYGQGDDHAEGIAVLDESDAATLRLLVVYDSPSPRRLTDRGVLADVVAFKR